MAKNYILDTNVLLTDATSIFKFEDNNVIIPIGVIEELDKFKKDMTELGRNAREVSRSLDDLRGQGDLRAGIKTDNGGTIAVKYNGNFDSYYKETNVDLHVIHLALKIKENDKDHNAIIVSRDINVRVRADALGLEAENYDTNVVEYKDLEGGYAEIYLDPVLFEELKERQEIPIKDIYDIEFPKHPNYYYMVHDSSVHDSSKNDNDCGDCGIMARMNPEGTAIRRLISCPQDLTIKPRNREQGFVVDALMDNDINLVAISGKAGTGKTILAVSVGMHLVETEKRYKRLLVSRPVFPMGRDLGFLPGDIEAKLDPWMQPIYDAFDVICQNNKNQSGREIVEQNHRIVVEPLTYIRGRSIHDQVLIVDEAQNLTPLELKTIITRAGDNTKIVLTGDINQIDNPYIDSMSNGLATVISAFKDSKLAAGIVMSKGERSALSEEATERM
tara:strand:+ start:4964 stop:6298 length:1335 start_codon:yes stop_codon:yes gene_type:complete